AYRAAGRAERVCQDLTGEVQVSKHTLRVEAFRASAAGARRIEANIAWIEEIGDVGPVVLKIAGNQHGRVVDPRRSLELGGQVDEFAAGRHDAEARDLEMGAVKTLDQQ